MIPMRVPEPYTIRTYGPAILLVLASIALIKHPAATP